MNSKKRKKKIIIGGVGTVFCVLLATLAYLYMTNNEETEINRITLKDLQPKIDFYLVGSIEPNRIVELKLDKNKGRITEKKVNLNDYVEAGQELFVYSNPEGALAIKEAEQAVTNREKAVEQAKLESGMKWEQYNKLTNQVNEVTNKIGKAAEEDKQELRDRKDELELQLNQTLLDARTTDNSITDAELELEKMQLELQNTRDQYGVNVITAEISGQIKEIDESQMNMNSSEKAPEKPFMTIVDTSQLYLRGYVDEFRRNQLQLDQTVQLMDRNGGSQRWTGKITKIGDLKQATVVDDEQGGNPNLSQFSFEVALDASEEPPVIGMHCFVELVQEENPVLKVPKNFVVEEKKNHYLFINKKGKVAKQKIDVSADPEDEELYILGSQLDQQIELIFPTKSIEEGMKLDGADSAK